MTKRICVTGASGRAGRVTVRELLAHEYQVVATDRVLPPEDLGVRPLLADLTDYGQATEVLQGVDAVVHLANIPAPEIHTPATTFNQMLRHGAIALDGNAPTTLVANELLALVPAT
jgi:nucleoside-diphosphate-sugar epimerase